MKSLKKQKENKSLFWIIISEDILYGIEHLIEINLKLKQHAFFMSRVDVFVIFVYTLIVYKV